MEKQWTEESKKFLEEVNKLRRGKKNDWYQWIGIVNGKSVRLKGYNTWIQVIRVDDVSESGIPDISVKEFNYFLHNAVN